MGTSISKPDTISDDEISTTPYSYNKLQISNSTILTIAEYDEQTTKKIIESIPALPNTSSFVFVIFTNLTKMPTNSAYNVTSTKIQNKPCLIISKFNQTITNNILKIDRKNVMPIEIGFGEKNVLDLEVENISKFKIKGFGIKEITGNVYKELDSIKLLQIDEPLKLSTNSKLNSNSYYVIYKKITTLNQFANHFYTIFNNNSCGIIYQLDITDNERIYVGKYIDFIDKQKKLKQVFLNLDGKLYAIFNMLHNNGVIMFHKCKIVIGTSTDIDIDLQIKDEKLSLINPLKGYNVTNFVIAKDYIDSCCEIFPKLQQFTWKSKFDLFIMEIDKDYRILNILNNANKINRHFILIVNNLGENVKGLINTKFNIYKSSSYSYIHNLDADNNNLIVPKTNFSITFNENKKQHHSVYINGTNVQSNFKLNVKKDFPISTQGTSLNSFTSFEIKNYSLNLPKDRIYIFYSETDEFNNIYSMLDSMTHYGCNNIIYITKIKPKIIYKNYIMQSYQDCTIITHVQPDITVLKNVVVSIKSTKIEYKISLNEDFDSSFCFIPNETTKSHKLGEFNVINQDTLNIDYPSIDQIPYTTCVISLSLSKVETPIIKNELVNTIPKCITTSLINTQSHVVIEKLIIEISKYFKLNVKGRVHLLIEMEDEKKYPSNNLVHCVTVKFENKHFLAVSRLQDQINTKLDDKMNFNENVHVVNDVHQFTNNNTEISIKNQKIYNIPLENTHSLSFDTIFEHLGGRTLLIQTELKDTIQTLDIDLTTSALPTLMYFCCNKNVLYEICKLHLTNDNLNNRKFLFIIKLNELYQIFNLEGKIKKLMSDVQNLEFKTYQDFVLFSNQYFSLINNSIGFEDDTIEITESEKLTNNFKLNPKTKEFSTSGDEFVSIDKPKILDSTSHYSKCIIATSLGNITINGSYKYFNATIPIIIFSDMSNIEIEALARTLTKCNECSNLLLVIIRNDNTKIKGDLENVYQQDNLVFCCQSKSVIKIEKLDSYYYIRCTIAEFDYYYQIGVWVGNKAFDPTEYPVDFMINKLEQGHRYNEDFHVTLNNRTMISDHFVKFDEVPNNTLPIISKFRENNNKCITFTIAIQEATYVENQHQFISDSNKINFFEYAIQATQKQSTLKLFYYNNNYKHEIKETLELYLGSNKVKLDTNTFYFKNGWIIYPKPKIINDSNFKFDTVDKVTIYFKPTSTTNPYLLLNTDGNFTTNAFNRTSSKLSQKPFDFNLINLTKKPN